MHQGLQGRALPGRYVGRGAPPRLGAEHRRTGGRRGLGLGPGAPGPGNRVVAAVSVSGPLDRLSRQPGRLHAPAVTAAADKLTEALRRVGGKSLDQVDAGGESPPRRRV